MGLGGMNLGGIYAEVKVRMDKFNKDLNGAVKQMDTAGNKMKKSIGVPMASVRKTANLVSAAYLGVAGATVAVASGFDKEMRNVNAIAQESEETFAKLQDRVLDFSMTTRASSADVARSLYNVVSAGYETADAFEIMSQASRSAGAGLADATSVSKLLIGTLRSYNMAATDSQYATDIFLQAVNQGITTLPELAGSLGRIMPLASKVGISFEEVAFSIAQMTQTGLSTEESVTRLMGAVNGMIKPTQNLSAVFAEMGFTTATAAIEAFGGLNGLLAEMQERGYDTAEELGSLFSNIRGMTGAMSLMGNETAMAAGALDDFKKASEGAVERAREQQYKSLSAQLARLKSAFEVVAIEIGTKFIPILVDIIKDVVPVIRSFSELDDQFIKTALAVGAVVAAVGPILTIFSKIQLLGSALMSLVSTLGLAGGALGTFATSVGLTATAIGGVLSVAAPYLAVFAAIAAAVTVGVKAIKKHNDKLQEEADEILVTSDSLEEYKRRLDEAGLSNRAVADDIYEATKALLEQGTAAEIAPELMRSFEEAIEEWERLQARLATEPTSFITERDAVNNRKRIDDAREAIRQFGVDYDALANVLVSRELFTQEEIDDAKEWAEALKLTGISAADAAEEHKSMQAHLTKQATLEDAAAKAAYRNRDALDLKRDKLEEVGVALDEDTNGAYAWLEALAAMEEAQASVTDAIDTYLGVLGSMTEGEALAALGLSDLNTAQKDIISNWLNMTNTEKDAYDITGALTDSYGDNTDGLNDLAKALFDASVGAENYVDEQLAINQAIADGQEALQNYASKMSTLHNLFSDAIGEATSIEEGYKDTIVDIEGDLEKEIAAIKAPRLAAQKELNDALIALENEKAAEIHRIMTGAHARSPEENAEALQWAENVYDEKERLLRESYATEVAEVSAGEAAKTQAARDAAEERKQIAADERQAAITAQQEAMADTLAQVSLNVMEQEGVLSEYFGNIASTGDEVWSLIKAGVIKLTPEILSAMQEITAGITDEYGTAAGNITENNEAILSAMDGLIPGFIRVTDSSDDAAKAVDVFADAADDAVVPVDNVADSLQDLADIDMGTGEVVTVIEDIGEAADDAVTALDDATTATDDFVEAIDEIPGADDTGLDEVITAAGDAETAMNDAETATDDYVEAIDEIPAEIPALEDMQTAAEDTVEDTLDALLTMTEEKLGELPDIVKDLVIEGITKYEDDFKAEAVEVGVDIGEGFIVGVLQRSAKFNQTIVDMIEAAYAAGRAAAQSQSPSQLFADLGGDLTAGMTQGALAQAEQGGGGLPPFVSVFADLIRQAAAVMGQIGGEDVAERADAIAGTISAIAGAMADLSEAMLLVSSTDADFSGVGTRFVDMMKEIDAALRYVVSVSGRWEEEVVDKADATTGLMGGVAGVIVDTIDAFTELQGYIDYQPEQTIAKLTLLIERMGLATQALVEESKKFDAADVIAVGNFADSVSKVIDLINGSIEAMVALAESKPVYQLEKKVGLLAGSIGQIVLAFRKLPGWRDTAGWWREAAMFAEEIEPLISIVKGGIEAVVSLADFEPVYMLESKVGLLVGSIGQLALAFRNVPGWREASAWWREGALFADEVKPLVDIVAGGVEAMAALAEFKPVYQIGAKVELLAAELGLLALAFKNIPDWRAAAGWWVGGAEFASEVKPLVDIVAGGVEAIAALAEIKPVYQLGEKVNILAGHLGQLALAFKNIPNWREADDWWKAGAQFAEDVKPLIDVVSGGIDAITKLSEAAPVQGIAAKVKTLAGNLGQVALAFKNLPNWREADDWWKAGAQFAADIQPIIGIIQSGIEALRALDRYTAGVRIGAGITKFMADLTAFITKFAQQTPKINEKLMEAAKQFAADAGSIVGVVGGAIDALTGIFAYGGTVEAESKAKFSMLEAMDQFIARLKTFIEKFIAMTQEFDAEAVAGAGDFSEDANKLVTLAKGGLEMLSSLAEFGTEFITPRKIDVMVDIIRYIMDSFIWLGTTFSPEALEMASIFADDIKTVFAIIKDALDTLAQIGETVLPDRSAIDNFVNALSYITGQLGSAQAESAAMITQSAKIASNMVSVAKNMIIAAGVAGKSLDVGGSTTLEGGLPGSGKKLVGDFGGGSIANQILPHIEWGGIVGRPSYGGGGGGGGGSSAATDDRRDAILSDIRDTTLNLLDAFLFVSERQLGFANGDLWGAMDEYIGGNTRTTGSFFGGRRVFS